MNKLIFFILGFILAANICVANAASCTISAQDIYFGNYSTIDASPTDANGSVTVNCTGSGLVKDIELSAGQSGSFTPRKMKRSGGIDELDYNLYQDMAYTQIWGEKGNRYKINQQAPYNATIPVYGRIPALQSVVSGLYQDQITATITFN